MTLTYANSQTRAAVMESVAVALMNAGGAFTLAQAWDESARHWAYPDAVLADLGYAVAFYGDTGGHGFAVTTSGIYLSSNGHCHKVESVVALRSEYFARGFIGKRLHGAA